MRNILIFEPDSSGHRMVFVQYLLRSMLRRGDLYGFLVTTAAAQTNPLLTEIEEEFRTILSILTIDFIDKGSSCFSFIHPTLKKQVVYFRTLRKFVIDLKSKTQVDYILIPFLDDYCLYPLSFYTYPFGRIPWGGVIIRPRFHLKYMGALLPSRWEDFGEGFAYRLLLRGKTLARVFSIDPYIVDYFRSKKMVSLPDPSDILSVVPDDIQLNIPYEAVVLLVYGYIDHRKAIDRLLVAALNSSVPQYLTLLLVGQQSTELSCILHGDIASRLRVQGRLVEVDRYVTDREEATVFRRADVVWVFYPHNYCSSGVLVRAGQTACPVVATREGLVGLMVSKLNMGLTVAEDDDEGLVLALSRLASDSNLRSVLGRAGFDYFSKYTADAFADPIIADIADVLEYSER